MSEMGEKVRQKCTLLRIALGAWAQGDSRRAAPCRSAKRLLRALGEGAGAQ